MLVLFPRDVDPDINPKDKHGFPNITNLHKGEVLDKDLNFLESHNLTKTVNLCCTKSDDSLLFQIVDAFDAMVKRGPWLYPETSNPATNLPLTAPNREVRLLMINLRFHFICVGYNLNGPNGRRLKVNDMNWFDFTYARLKQRFSNGRNAALRHPTNPTEIQGLIFICPREGGQLTGPINDNHTEIHACYTDFILKGLQKAWYLEPRNYDDEPQEERLERLNADYPLSCRSNCPGQISLAQDTQLEDDASQDSQLPAIRRSSRLQAASATASRSSSVHNTTPPGPISPVISTSTSQYLDTHTSEFADFQAFEWDIETKRDSGPEFLACFEIEGDTVDITARGLFLALQSVHQDPQAPLISPLNDLAFVIKPTTATITKIFSYAQWFCRGGLQRYGDVVGSGVLREILGGSLKLCLEPEYGMLKDTANGDGYLTLRLSPDFVSAATLDMFYALGVICALYMIKAHNGPAPISPALVQAAIGGFDSLIDEAWVRATCPEIASKLVLLPADAGTAIPDDRELRLFISSKLPGIRFQDLLTSVQRIGLPLFVDYIFAHCWVLQSKIWCNLANSWLFQRD